jgi:probable HAF family extracellular repeat protein
MPGGVAFDASRSGVVVGAVVNDLLGRQFPAVWTSPGGPGRLLRGLRGISDGTAFAINERGRVAGIAGGAAVIWDGIRRAPRRIGTLPGGILGELVALNDLGDAAGRTSFPDGTTEAMLWLSPERRLAGLGFLDGAYSFAYGVNGARQVVGTASAGEAVHAFLWEAGVMRDLNDLVASSSGPFLHLSSAVAIDEAGRIAAEAVVPTPSGSATRAAILVPAVP